MSAAVEYLAPTGTLIFVGITTEEIAFLAEQLSAVAGDALSG